MTTVIANASTDTRLASILADGADGAAFPPNPVAAALDALEASAVAMGVALGAAESASAMAAKDWGCNYLNLVKVHGHDGDDLAQRTRAALGWADLKGEAGSVIKRRFNTWRSNVGVLSGRWSEVGEDDRTALLGGTRSFITVYKALIDADKVAKAKKAADEAAAAMAAKSAADDANKSADEGGSAPGPVTATDTGPDFFALLAAARAMIDPATLSNAMVEAANALIDDINAAVALIEADEPVAVNG